MANRNLTSSGYFAVEFLCVVLYMDGEGFFAAVEFQIGRHSPRVPAGTVSAKGHDTFGDFFTVGTGDEYFGIEQ